MEITNSKSKYKWQWICKSNNNESKDIEDGNEMEWNEITDNMKKHKG